MLEIRNVHKTFNLGTINEKHALNGVNLKLDAGDFVTVIGGNGAGKSTVLNAVAGLCKFHHKLHIQKIQIQQCIFNGFREFFALLFSNVRYFPAQLFKLFFFLRNIFLQSGKIGIVII